MANDGTAPATTRKVRFGGAEIGLTEWGAGSPVLLLHGNPDSSRMWDDLAGRLGAHYRCIAPDLPGFGHSDMPASFTPTLDGMAQFVEQVLEAANIPRPLDLIAHDFGGPFAFAWAVKHADAVRRIVPINTIFFSDYRWHFWAMVWRTPLLGELSMLLMNKAAFARELRRGGKLSDAHIDRTWALMTPRTKKAVLRLYRMSSGGNFRDWEEKFLALTATKPTLVIWGDNDPYIAPRFAERFNARKVVHRPVGHWAPVEAPAECAAAILQFFDETA